MTEGLYDTIIVGAGSAGCVLANRLSAPTRTRQSLGDSDSAALVRGSDDYGNFHHTPVFASDFDGAAVAFHDRATRAVREILYRDARQATGKL